MAIPISEYIGVQTNINNADGGIDLIGLIISNDEMVTGAAKKTEYDRGDMLTLDITSARQMFSDCATASILSSYGYSKIKVMKKLSDDDFDDTFDDACETDNSFGQVCITSTQATDIEDVATKNSALGAQHLFIAGVTAGTASTVGALTNKYLCKVYVGNGSSPDWTQIGAVLGWAASLDFTATNGFSALMYKDLDVNATVSDLTTKNDLDDSNINYCGLVQYYGSNVKFFQMGKCADGTDVGCAMAEIYMTVAIARAWISLAMGSKKVPANTTGALMVRAMVMDVAETAKDNGSILVDKPLTNAQISLIEEFTGSSDAYISVQSIGYYIDTKIDVQDGNYVVEYTLVYAKGDHIAKVNGTHNLV